MLCRVFAGSRALWALGASLVVVICALPVAAEAARVGIFPIQSTQRGINEQELEALSQKLVAAITAKPGIEIVRKYPFVGGRTPGDVNALARRVLAPVKRKLAIGRKHLDAGRFEQAVRQFQTAIRDSGAAIRLPGSFALAARALALVAMAHLHMGRNGEAENELIALATTNPTPLPLEVRKFPAMRFRYKRARNRAVKFATGSIKVQGTPAAKVFVDGREVGTSPVTVSRLPRGIHFVRVYARGFVPGGQSMRVVAGAVTEMSYKLPPAPVGTHGLSKSRQTLASAVMILSFTGAQRAAAARTIGIKTNVRWILTGNLRKASTAHILVPVLIDTQTGKYVRLDEVQLDAGLLDVDTPMSQVVKTALAKMPGGGASPAPSVAATPAPSVATPTAATGGPRIGGAPRPPATPQPAATPKPRVATAAGTGAAGAATAGPTIGASPKATPKPAPKATPKPSLAPSVKPRTVAVRSPEPRRIRVTPGPAPGTPVPPRSRSVLKKWWFWTIIGAALAGGGTAGYLLLRPKTMPVIVSWQTSP